MFGRSWFRVSGGLLTSSIPDIPDNYRSRLELQWPLYTGGRGSPRSNAPRGAEARRRPSTSDAARADLRLEIARAYWALVTAARTAARRRANRLRALRRTRGRAQAARRRPRPAERCAARRGAGVAAADAGIQARGNRDVAEAELARLVGDPPGTPISRRAALGRAGAVERGLDALVAEARVSAAGACGAARSASTRRESAAKAAAGSHRPTVGVGGGFDYARPNPRIFPREREWA